MYTYIYKYIYIHIYIIYLYLHIHIRTRLFCIRPLDACPKDTCAYIYTNIYSYVYIYIYKYIHILVFFACELLMRCTSKHLYKQDYNPVIMILWQGGMLQKKIQKILTQAKAKELQGPFSN